MEMAMQNGMKILGFSDHMPLPTDNERLTRFRMKAAELPAYLESIDALKENYAGDIKIYKGFEMEYFPQYFDWMREQLEQHPVDYLVFGNHFDPERGENGYYGEANTADEIKSYEKTAIAGMESGLFACFAHPDLYLNAYHTFDKTCAHTAHAICEAAAALGMPLEYNLFGEERRGSAFSTGLGYTRPEFWEIAAKYPVKAIIGCDAHAIDHLNRGERMRARKEMLEAQGICVLDTLPNLG